MEIKETPDFSHKYTHLLDVIIKSTQHVSRLPTKCIKYEIVKLFMDEKGENSL